MKKTFLISTLVLSLTFISAQDRCFINLSCEEFYTKINSKDLTLIDCRTPGEFKSFHIKGAKPLSIFDRNFKEKIRLLPKDQSIYLYCYSGHRSVKAAKILCKNGYKEVYNLEPGFMNWKKTEMPIVMGASTDTNHIGKIKRKDYKALIESESQVLVYFYSPWNASCRKSLQTIDRTYTEYKDKLKIHKINIDTSIKFVKGLKIKSTPYLALYKDGKKIFEQYSSVDTLQLQEILKPFLD